MFKFKRFGVSAIAAVLLSNTLLFSTPAFAEETTTSEPTVTTEEVVTPEPSLSPEEAQVQELIQSLEPYVTADNNQFEVESIPTAVYNEFGADDVNSMLEGVEELNELAQDGEIIITDNETVYEADDTSFDVQGGVNKIVWTWYGRKSYMSTARANDFAYYAKKVATGAGGVSLIAGFFSFGTATVFSGLTGLYFANLADDVERRNSGHSRGIIVNMTWAAAYWTARQ